MKKDTGKKTGVMALVLYIILFAVFNFLVFVIFEKHSNVFWISYIFMCLAFVVQIVSMLLALQSIEIEAFFKGIPLVSLSIYYFFAAIFTGAVFMVFQISAFTLAFVLQLLVLVIYLIVAILALMSRKIVQDVSDNLKENVQFIKMMNIHVDSLMPYVTDSNLKKELRKVSEVIKYSDPMSNNQVEKIENDIIGVIGGLEEEVRKSDTINAIKSCKTIEALFAQRNAILKATK